MKPLYIISSSCISAQKTFDEETFLTSESLIHTKENILFCIEPDFKKYINPVQIRRMSRALKIGFTAALHCIEKSDVESIDAIIIGTGKGCLIDTESFLHSIKEYHETALNPTHFIHSTYNQLNGMIALNKKINSYNVTYAHRGFSFESTIIDAMLLAEENENLYILVGSFDEITQEHFDIKKQWNYWKKENIDSLELLNSETEGTIAGEGSSFFMLSNLKTNRNQVCIKAINTLYKPNEDDLKHCIETILLENNLNKNDIDIVMYGHNGDANQSKHQSLFQEYFSESVSLGFKHLCGEYDTASQFGFWICNQILLQQHIPQTLYLNSSKEMKKPIRNILLYNNYFESNQSIFLLNIELI